MNGCILFCTVHWYYGDSSYIFVFFFFQAEDGIRDYKVTGVQTCALPISLLRVEHDIARQLRDGRRDQRGLGGREPQKRGQRPPLPARSYDVDFPEYGHEIGRASCRERV